MQDPVELCQEWWGEAQREGLLLPETCALATATPAGRPSVRMVLLKGIDEKGFAFYTNYRSRKARELDANPWGSLCFYWGPLERQVRVEGSVERTTRAECEAYFETRPRGSQIGAWASSQSSVLGSRAELEERAEEMRRRFSGGEVPLPDFWGGYRLRPSRIEFWSGRPDRLHDRRLYERDDRGAPWRMVLLQP